MPYRDSEQKRAYNRAYYQEHRAERVVYNRAYREAHKDEARARAHAYNASENGRAAKRRSSRRRRARKACLPATLTEKDWNYCVGWFGNACAYCGATDVPLQQDHVVSQMADGGYVATNIVPACERCNASKGTTPPADWVVRRGAAFVSPNALANVEAYLAIIVL